MSRTTIFLSKLFGLYYLLIALTMVLHRRSLVETVTSLFHNAQAMFLVGVITMLAGLAMVLVHNVWRGGVATVIVTLIGWIVLAKGLTFLLLAPQTAADLFLAGLQFARLYFVYVVFELILGVYLAYSGFTAGPQA